jgi:hypothetical protein
VRIFAALVLSGLTAACAAPPESAPGSTPTASAIAALLGPPPPAAAPVALVPAPIPTPTPTIAAASAALEPVPPVWYSPSGYTWVGPLPIPFSWLGAPQPGGRLSLNNFSFDEARVQVVLTNRPDCTVAAPATTGDFVLPLNATRVIPTPPGFDICWRREAPQAASAPAARAPMPEVPGWADWNRAYTATGRSIDMRL